MIRRALLPLAIFFLPALMAFADVPPHKTFFTAQKIGDRWWLIDPAGKEFISTGVDEVDFAPNEIRGTHISPYGQATAKKYKTIEAWRKATARQLFGWGFNTLGSWSDVELAKVDVDGRHLAYSVTLNLGAGFVAQKVKNGQAWLHGIFPDVFDPEFEKSARASAEQQCVPRKDDPELIGWFSDNELRWGPDWRGKDELLTMFLNLPPKTPGRDAALAMLQKRYKNFAAFNQAWKTPLKSWEQLAASEKVTPPYLRKGIYAQNANTEELENHKDPARAAFTGDCDAFVELLAERYFKICHEAIKAADPNHMDLGCRFAYPPPQPVIAAAAQYVDCMSFNCYATDPRPMIQQFAAFHKPLLIGEFAFRGEDVGLPNSQGAGPKVKTQQDRANAFTNYATWALSEPNLVGYHWFEHSDEPKEGRFDGENCNYGIVNAADEPYQALTEAMTKINKEANALHAGKP